jgi:hypothetical protein
MVGDLPSPLRGPGEIAEDEAGPALRETYARIAGLLGVPFVPTIYRMLGRWPDWLAAAVDTIGPLLATREADAFATDARQRAASAALPGDAVHAGDDAPAVLAVLERYNRANPRSLLFATALDGGAPRPRGLMGPGAPDASPWSGDPGGVLEDVRARHGGLVLPGVWRELAGWPDLLEAAWRQVRPLAAVPAFQHARTAVADLALAATSGTVAPSPADHGVPDADLAELATITGWFAHGIPAVIVEIEYLRRLVTT